MSLWMNDLFHQRNRPEDPEGGGQHDDAGQQDAEGHIDHALAEVHVQDAGGQGAGPGSRSGQGNAYEQQQGDVQTPAGLGFEFGAGFLAFFQAPAEEAADQRFILAPFQHFPPEQKNEGDRKHVADDGDDVGGDEREVETDGIGDGAAQFDQRDHRNQEDDQVLLEHLLFDLGEELPHGIETLFFVERPLGRIGNDQVEGVAGQLDAADLELGLGTFCHEFQGIVGAADQGDEEVGLGAEHQVDLLAGRLAAPVEVFFEDGIGDAGDQALLAADLAEVEEEDFAFDAIVPEEGLQGNLAGVKGGVLHVNERDGGFNLAHRQDASGGLALEFLEVFLPEEAFY